jgi:hypothetical protein
LLPASGGEDYRVISPAKLRPIFVAIALFSAVPAALFAVLPPADAPEAERVVMVANASVSDSRELAEYYASARGIPLENIVALPMPTAETVSWPDFVSGIFNPLFAELVQRGWIEATPTQGIDPFGRRRTMVLGHRIRYLSCLCAAYRCASRRIPTGNQWRLPLVRPPRSP